MMEIKITTENADEKKFICPFGAEISVTKETGITECPAAFSSENEWFETEDDRVDWVINKLKKLMDDKDDN